MSLINRVLHDLEDRSAFASCEGATVISDLRSAQDYAEQDRRARTRFALSVAVLLSFMLCFLLIEYSSGALHLTGNMHPAVPAALSPPATAQMGKPPVHRLTAAPRAATAPALPPGMALKLALSPTLPAALDNTEEPQDAPGSAMSPPPPRLTWVEHASGANDADIHLGMSTAVTYRLSMLTGPDRLMVELPAIDVDAAVLANFRPDGMVKDLRFSREADRSVLVFDLAAPAVVDSSQISQQSPDAWDFDIRLSASDLHLVSSIPATGSAPAEPAAAPEAVDAPVLKTVHAPDQSEQAGALYRKATEAYRLGDADAATSDLNESLELDPASVRSRQLLASLLVARNDLQQALAVVQGGLQYHPDDLSLMKTHARVLLQMGRPDSALEALGQNPPAVQDDTEYYALAAAIYQQQKDYALAADAYGRLLHVNPRDGTWWAGLGIALEGLGRSSDALAAYLRAASGASMPADLADYVGKRLVALKQGRS